MNNPYAPPRAVVQDIPQEGQIVLADRGARFGASILDTFFFGLMVYMPFIIALVTLGSFGQTPPSESDVILAMFGSAGLVGLAGFAVWFGLTITYMKRNGQSIAKKMLSIKVVRSDGSPASLGRLVLLRNVLNLFISVVPLYGIIDSLFIFGEARQCLHDKIADTIVIRA
jgi:uncharacterized RDD family membrane protein YckC